MGEKDKKDLTVSQVDRQNILNNPYSLQEREKANDEGLKLKIYNAISGAENE